MNKRSASGGFSVATPPRKRKMDNGPKFYAVQAGFRPGVYLTYAECSAQTAGFKGAVFKSFTSRSDAEAFAAGKKVAASSDEPERFYAVAVGNPTGIYTDWSDAAASIKGVKGPKYKRFASRKEAVAYIRQFGNREAVEALGEAVPSSEPVLALQQSISPATPAQKPAPKSAAVKPDTGIVCPIEGALQIYTDGSSLANGREGSRAGVGVYFGDGDARNVSERLVGDPQTNQRAELMAMLRAHWVKGHASNRGNMAADRLAVRGAKLS